MDKKLFLYAGIMMFGVFISAISQVMLKKAAQKTYESKLKEYLNPLVIFAYVIFVAATFCSIFAYKVVPLSMGPVIEATSYIYVTIFGYVFFKERVTKRKVIALLFILSGVVIFSFC